MHHLYILLALFISSSQSSRLTGLRGTGIFSNANRKFPGPVPITTNRQSPASPGIRNATREGKVIFRPFLQGLKRSQNVSCTGEQGTGRCIFAWECSKDDNVAEIITTCSKHLFHQCCIPKPTLQETQSIDRLFKEIEDMLQVHMPVPSSTTQTPELMKKPAPLFIRKFPKETSSPTINETTTTEPSSSSEFDNWFLNPKNFDCGYRPLGGHRRILGGTKAEFGAWPWIVSIRKLGGRDKDGNSHKSGGSLISDQWILTAAHTVARTARIIVPDDSILVRLGDYNLTYNDPIDPHVDRKVSKIIVHPGFNSITYENDIALLKLEEKVEFKDHIQPVCLPPPDGDSEVSGRQSQADDELLPRSGIVAGWGRTSQGGELSDVLLQVELPIISHTDCESMFAKRNYNEAIPELFICAGGSSEGGKDSCQGDSGGPLVVNMRDEATNRKIDDRWVIQGIVSWGIGCGISGLPGVLTSVPHYTNWIIRSMQEGNSTSTAF